MHKHIQIKHSFVNFFLPHTPVHQLQRVFRSLNPTDLIRRCMLIKLFEVYEIYNINFACFRGERIVGLAFIQLEKRIGSAKASC